MVFHVIFFYIYIKENNATQTDIRKDFLPLKSQCMGFQKTKEKKLLYFTVSIYIYIYIFFHCKWAYGLAREETREKKKNLSAMLIEKIVTIFRGQEAWKSWWGWDLLMLRDRASICRHQLLLVFLQPHFISHHSPFFFLIFFFLSLFLFPISLSMYYKKINTVPAQMLLLLLLLFDVVDVMVK